MKLIFGLGNPGPEYEKTRHNIGFRILDAFAQGHDSSAWTNSDKATAQVADLQINGEKVILAKPQSFMNLSGGPLLKLVNYYKLDAQQDVLVVFDDKDLLFGTLRQKEDSSSGGHNGIKSIIEALGSEQFHRLKVGVGHEEQGIPTKAFVLQKFTSEEEQALPDLSKQAISLIEDWLAKQS